MPSHSSLSIYTFPHLNAKALGHDNPQEGDHAHSLAKSTIKNLRTRSGSFDTTTGQAKRVPNMLTVQDIAGLMFIAGRYG